jgi:hypothetical protein
MAQNTTVSFDIADGWTQLTDANITAITFQVRTGGTVLIQATSGATAPSADEGSLTYKTGQGEANRSLADLFPGVSGANRVYAKAAGSNASVFVSHA